MKNLNKLSINNFNSFFRDETLYINEKIWGIKIKLIRRRDNTIAIYRNNQILNEIDLLVSELFIKLVDFIKNNKENFIKDYVYFFTYVPDLELSNIRYSQTPKNWLVLNKIFTGMHYLNAKTVVEQAKKLQVSYIKIIRIEGGLSEDDISKLSNIVFKNEKLTKEDCFIIKNILGINAFLLHNYNFHSLVFLNSKGYKYKLNSATIKQLEKSETYISLEFKKDIIKWTYDNIFLIDKSNITDRVELLTDLFIVYINQDRIPIERAENIFDYKYKYINDEFVKEQVLSNIIRFDYRYGFVYRLFLLLFNNGQIKTNSDGSFYIGNMFKDEPTLRYKFKRVLHSIKKTSLKHYLV